MNILDFSNYIIEKYNNQFSVIEFSDLLTSLAYGDE